MVQIVSIKDINEFNAIGKEVNDNFLNLFNLQNILDSPYSVVYGYYVNSLLVGFLHIDRSFEVVDIVNVVVSKDYLRQGIATQLFKYCFNDLKDVSKYLLEVKVTNEQAISLYKKLGFEIINTRYKYYNGIDGYVMEKRCNK